MRALMLPLLLLLCAVTPGRAIEVRVSAPALERTLARQLFNQADTDGNLTRHYLRGNAAKGCAVYADEPHVSFRDDRVVVKVKTHARLGFGKLCIGITVAAEAEVSFIPEAEGESVGFRDAKIEHFSGNRELDQLLEPFLARKLPEQMTVNAADLIRKLLVKAPDSTRYQLTLEKLELHSMQVSGDVLLVDLDANFRVD